jgi:hypothetical protein
VYRRTGWSRVAQNGQRIIHFSMKKGMEIISKGQMFSYTRESYQQLGQYSLLAIGAKGERR